MLQLLIFMKPQPFSYCFVFTKAPNMINNKWRSAYMDQYPIWHILCVVILNISGDRASFLLFCVSELLELEIITAQTISTH